MHRGRVSLFGALLRAEPQHQVFSTKPLNQVVERREPAIADVLTLEPIELQALAVAPERVGAREPAQELRLGTKRFLIAQCQSDAEMIEKIDERGFPGPNDFRFAECEEEVREGFCIVQCAVRLARIDSVYAGEIDELGAAGVQLAGEQQRVVRTELIATERLCHSPQNRKVEVVAVVRDDYVRAAECAEFRPDALEERRAGYLPLVDAVGAPCSRSDRNSRLHHGVKLAGQLSVAHTDCGDLHDFRARNVLVGALDVDGGEIAEVVGEGARASELRRLEKRQRDPEGRLAGTDQRNCVLGANWSERYAPKANPREHSPERDLRAAERRDPYALSAVERRGELVGKSLDVVVLGRIAQVVVMLLEHCAVLADALRQKLLYERAQRGVTGSERDEIPQGIKAAPDFPRIPVLPRELARQLLEVREEILLSLFGLGARAIEERSGKDDL